MFLKDDFLAALRDAIQSRPAAAAAYLAGDPRLLASLEADATMLAMLSQQIDLAEAEPFLKARDGTVIADAALKGVLPLARPAQVSLSVANGGTVAVPIASGRSVVDGSGRRYVTESAVTIGAGLTATVTARQATTRTITHTVSATYPFYSVLVDQSPDGLKLAGVEVSDAGGQFAYAAEFTNVAAGDRVFHAETDQQRRLWLRFGASDAAGAIVGHQPANGDVLTIVVTECEGAVELKADTGFALEYVGNADEQMLTLSLGTVLSPGYSEPSIEVLRMLARYPALHDSNAVHLSNFDFLLRRHLPSSIRFLSVWNEQAEESVRGASVANINKLFVSVVVDNQVQAVTEAQVRQIIARADDSYKVVFMTPVQIAVPVSVTASVAAVHDTAQVESQIRATLLALYGLGTVNASRGFARTFRVQAAHAELKAKVPALQDAISDFSLAIGATASPLPEHFRYFTTVSISVSVTRLQDTVGLWSV